MTQADVDLYRKMQASPRFFVKTMWGLVPERNNALFVKGKHITWQQDDILQAVEDAVNGLGRKRISIASGHGTGKSTVLAWLVLWYLYCHKDAQIPCTAPTSDQMYDVLWKEIAKWLNKMPDHAKKKYEWSSSHVRIVESPETWFARAKTASKETPEALAGIHGDYVMMIIDEASGVPQEIFNTAEGALTSANILVIMPSNPTRSIGYFYDSHHSDKANWQTFTFSSADSPIVDRQYVARIAEKHGEESDEYRIRVYGQFPKEDAVDESGYVPLLNEADLRFTTNSDLVGRRYMGIDPSGEGDDDTLWVVRDDFKAKVAAKEKISNPKSIAQKTMTLTTYHEVKPEDETVDNFGVGANVSQELAMAGIRINAVNVGEKCNAGDDEKFVNLRAKGYWTLREWILKGGELVHHELWKELLTIRYRRELSGKIKIMSKEDMRKRGIKSPNCADALMMSFVRDQVVQRRERPKEQKAHSYYGKNFAEREDNSS